jgi:hypothetical protein
MANDYYTERKKCKKCNNEFSEFSIDGNPYKFCPTCRSLMFEKIVEYCQKNAIKKIADKFKKKNKKGAMKKK